MALQLFLQLGLPALLLPAVWRARPGRRVEWLVDVSLAVAWLGFVWLTARWDSTSYWLRCALPVVLAVAAWIGARRVLRSPEAEAGRGGSLSGLFSKAALALVGLALVGGALLGHLTPPESLALAHPLRGGIYYVGGGGDARLINNHQAHRSQRHALDIVRLNALGNRARGLSPSSLESYAIFGDEVYSPCVGVVARATDGLPDQIPPARDTERLAGNHVVIVHQGVKVVLAHLARGSVAVAVGDEVREGQLLGRVGNSGNSSQPHLHVHAERGGADGEILSGEAVPILLGGRFLVRNSLFTGER